MLVQLLTLDKLLSTQPSNETSVALSALKLLSIYHSVTANGHIFHLSEPEISKPFHIKGIELLF